MRQMAARVAQHYRAEQGLMVLRGRMRHEGHTTRQAQAEQQRHNAQIQRQIEQYRKQAEDTRLMTKTGWEFERLIAQPLLPPVSGKE